METTDEIRKLVSLLNEIEIKCDPPIGSAKCNHFSVDCLSLIRHKLPPIAAEGFLCLTEYLSGQATLNSVIEVRLKCWQHLQEHHKHVPLKDPVVSAIRAVIFPLHAQQNPDDRNVVDHLSFFLELINNVEPHIAEEESLLRKHFIGCIGTT